LRESINEIPDRPLMHPFRTAQYSLTGTGCSEEGCEKSKGCSGGSYIDYTRFIPKSLRTTKNGNRAITEPLYLDTELLQRIKKRDRVFARRDIVNNRSA
jgi:hypothetical protein